MQRAGRFEACEAVVDALIARGDDGAELFHLKGLMAALRADNVAAEHWLSRATTSSPTHVEALRLHGMVLRRLGRAEEALDRYAEMLAVDPNHAEGHLNRANAFNDLQRWSEALDAAGRALSIAPGFAGAMNAAGIALLGLGQAGEAKSRFQQAIALDPQYADALVNLGNAIAGAGDAALAMTFYDRALAINPRLIAGLNGRGNALAALQRWADAGDAYDRAVAVQPTYPGLLGQRLYARMKLCDWRDFDTLRGEVLAGIRSRRLTSTPFALLAVSENAQDERTCAETYVRQFLGTAPVSPPRPPPAPRIRIGYFSADFHNHATAHLMAEVFELHDRSQFEVTAFSFGKQSDDPVRRRLVPAFERFFDVAGMDDRAVVELSRGLGIDIAVDLKGYTLDARTGIFARRAAPVQVNYLGYPGTMGASFIDYLIADPVTVPEADQGAYAEKIAYLPGCYQPNDRKRDDPALATARHHHGLPETGFVFGCFNSNYKITPHVFAVWMRLLRQVDGSVLWLFRDDPAAADNLRRAAQASGIDPARLIFAEPRIKRAHLERLRHMDLFLDTSPYNAHTTGSDALWMGTPMVTMPGATFAARVGASLLTAAGAPDLIAGSWAEYEALAVALARDPSRLARIRAHLAKDRSVKRLFDTPRFTHDLEALYRAMHARRLSGQAPDHLQLRD